MKKLLLISISLIALSTNAQSVDRNDIVISVSPGTTFNYYESLDTSGPFIYGTDYWGMRAPVSLEYVFNRSLGISGDFNYTRLMIGTYHRSDFTVLDFGLGLRFHTPSSKRIINWFGEVGVHYSKLYFFSHGDISHLTIDANGWSLYYDVGANVPLSKSQKFGMGISLNGSGYKYLSASADYDTGTNFDFRMNALAFAAGLNFYYKL
jgi:opacity protein-like surface antigen